MRKVVFFVLFLLNTHFPTLLFGQAPSISFEHITTKDGLPSNSVLYAAKDKNGFMWFGTRKCPSRYDGYSFRNFLAIETGMVSGITADDENNIYIASDLNGIGKIEAHSFMQTSLPLSHDKSSKQTANIFIDSKGNGWYSDWYGINKLDLTTTISKHYPFRQTNYVWVKASFVEDNNGTLWAIGSDNGLFKYDSLKDTLICVLGADAEEEASRLPILFTHGIVDKEGFLWIATYNYGLIKYNPLNNSYETFHEGLNSKSIISLENGVDEKGNSIIWFGTNEGLGIFRPDQSRFYYFNNILPHPFSANHIFRDKEQGIVWISTSEGILKYHPKSNFIQSVFIPEGLVQLPVTLNFFLQDQKDITGNTVYIGLSHTGIIKWDKTLNNFSLIPFPSTGATAEVKWMIQKEDGTIWIGTNNWGYSRPGIFVYDPMSKQFIETPQSLEANKYFSVPFFMYGLFDEKDQLWIGNSDEGFHTIAADGKDLTPLDAESQYNLLLKDNNLINDMRFDKAGKLWLGTHNGLYFLDETTNTFVNADTAHGDIRPADFAINSLFHDSQGNIWAARWGSITRSGPDGQFIGSIHAKDGLFDRENKGIVEDKNGHLWFGNFDGLHYFDTTSEKLIGFTLNEGLISNNTLGRLFILDSNQLIIGQKNGFNLLEIEKIYAHKEEHAVAVSSFKIHNRQHDQDFSRPIVLGKKENSFSIDFVTLNFSKLQNNHYAYFLEGVDENWQHSDRYHALNYNNLEPGQYALHLKAGDAFGNWSIPKTLHIIVPPAFYQTWWFKATAWLMGCVLVFGLFRYRINAIKKEATFKQKVSETELMALRAQMNPHFIFNCLNSIQYYIAINEKDAAISFLSKFSKLIRFILENSAYETVNLSDELEMLSYYIDMEKLRLEDKFDTTIEVESTLFTDRIMVPTLLLQPYVENAIVHGLRHKEGHGYLSITIKKADANLICIIEDNGIGRHKSKELNSNKDLGHNSRGIRVTQQRIEALQHNAKGFQKAEVNIIDLENEKGYQTGTRVEISIPLRYD